MVLSAAVAAPALTASAAAAPRNMPTRIVSSRCWVCRCAQIVLAVVVVGPFLGSSGCGDRARDASRAIVQPPPATPWGSAGRLAVSGRWRAARGRGREPQDTVQAAGVAAADDTESEPIW